MIHRLVALSILALAFFSSPAQAAAPCWPTAFGGSGNFPVVRSSSVGVAVAWGCPNDFTPRIASFWGLWTAFVPNWQQEAAQIIADGKASMDAAWKQYVTEVVPDANGALVIPAEYTDIFPLIKDAFDAARASMPAAPVWAVALNSTYSTRPSYPIANGVRGSTSDGRATVGAPCNCAVRSVEGSSVYCAVNGGTTSVALCRKQ